MITRNNERTLERALASVRWADEIVVVDSFSTDKTPEICRRFTDRVIQRPWPGFREQYQCAADLTTHPWVMFIDADEEISQELAEEIQRVVKEGGKVSMGSSSTVEPTISDDGFGMEPGTRTMRFVCTAGRRGDGKEDSTRRLWSMGRWVLSSMRYLHPPIGTFPIRFAPLIFIHGLKRRICSRLERDFVFSSSSSDLPFDGSKSIF